jgi:hypothetical protein
VNLNSACCMQQGRLVTLASPGCAPCITCSGWRPHNLSPTCT